MEARATKVARATVRNMDKPNVKGQRLVALFLLGNLLFSSPC